MTKKEKAMYQNWKNATMRSLGDAYDNPSVAKQNSYRWCLEQATELGGYDIRIPSRNTFGFTFAYLFNMGETVYLRYETKDNTYVFEVESEAVPF